MYICVIHKILTVQNLPWNRIKQFVFLVDMGCVLRGVEIDILFLKKLNNRVPKVSLGIGRSLRIIIHGNISPHVHQTVQIFAQYGTFQTHNKQRK